jgi:hypothetical protein
VAVTTAKLGLFLPKGLHEQMVLAGARRLSGRKTPRGGVRLVYEQAFNDLLEALDAGQLVAFPAVRGAKHRISVRICGLLCARIRSRLDPLKLKLTDYTSTAIVRFLHPSEGA